MSFAHQAFLLTTILVGPAVFACLVRRLLPQASWWLGYLVNLPGCIGFAAFKALYHRGGNPLFDLLSAISIPIGCGLGVHVLLRLHNMGDNRKGA